MAAAWLLLGLWAGLLAMPAWACAPGIGRWWLIPVFISVEYVWWVESALPQSAAAGVALIAALWGVLLVRQLYRRPSPHHLGRKAGSVLGLDRYPWWVGGVSSLGFLLEFSPWRTLASTKQGLHAFGYVWLQWLTAEARVIAYGTVWSPIALVITLATVSVGLSWLRQRWTPPPGLGLALVAVVVWLVWPFSFPVPTAVHAVLMVLAWGPLVLHLWSHFLRATTKRPLARVGLVLVSAVVLWGTSTAAMRHTVSPTFPPGATAVVWADGQVPAPALSPSPWLVSVSAATARTKYGGASEVTRVNADASLVSGKVTAPPSSWQPRRLTATLATRTLNQRLAASLLTTNGVALGASFVVLLLALGSWTSAVLAIAMGLVVSILTLAGLSGFELIWPLSSYALNLVDILAIGLSVDYTVFQVHAFRHAWLQGRPTPDANQAADAADEHAGKAFPWSVVALMLTLAAFPVALPGGLGWGFAVAGATTAALTLWLNRLLVGPLLRAFPRVWVTGGLRWALSDWLDRVYTAAGRGLVWLPGAIFLVAFSGLLIADRAPLHIDLYAPTQVADLLPPSSTVRQAFADLTPSPGAPLALVVHVPTVLTQSQSWQHIQPVLQKLPTVAGVQWESTVLGNTSATSLAAWAALPSPKQPPLVRSLWHPSARTFWILARVEGSWQRTALNTQLTRYLPRTWTWGLTGGPKTMQAAANGWFLRALLIVVGAGLVASALVRWRITGRVGAGVLALLFEVLPFLTTLVAYPTVQRIWPTLLPGQLPFPLLLLAASLMLALALDYQVLFMHAVGRSVTSDGVADAVGRTGGSITAAGLVMGISFYALLLSPLPFLRAAGWLIGTNVLLDTLVIRTMVMPTTTAALMGSKATSGIWRQQWDRTVAGLTVLWAATALMVLIPHDVSQLRIQPRPLPVREVAVSSTLTGNSFWIPPPKIRP